MQPATQLAPVSKANSRIGWAMTGFVVLFLLFDAVIHILKIPPVVKSFEELGYPLSTAVALGIVELGCVLVYLWPRTAVLGAVLLTGYLGGAIATQVRVGNPLFSHVLFPVYIGLLIWGGLMLREPRVRSFLVAR